MGKNLILSGRPGVGKTTLIRAVLERLRAPARGFYTAELRSVGRREGFALNVLGQPPGILARVDIRSPHRVGRYGVDVGNFERTAVAEIEAAVREGCLAVIDEIGKMELFSDRFREAVWLALDSASPVLATLMRKHTPFTDRIRSRPDVTLFEVTEKNRDALVDDIILAVSSSAR